MHPGLAMLIVLGLSGCVRLGPDFQPPGEAWVDHWNSPDLEQASQRAQYPDIRQWWQVFDDPILDQLIAESDAHNSSLKIAGLRVMEARAQLGIAQSGRYPQLQQVTGDSVYVNRNQSGGTNPVDSHFWQHSAGFDIGWELDFWGRFSRAIESADASYFAAEANYDDVLVLLRAQVADSYFSLRTTEARLRVARENARQQQRNYEITERLFNSGQTAELDLQQAKTQYLGTLSTIPGLEDQLVRIRNALAVLIGRPPGALPMQIDNSGLIPLVDRAVLQDVPANLLLSICIGNAPGGRPISTANALRMRTN
jgi:outer membrane protein TolC